MAQAFFLACKCKSCGLSYDLPYVPEDGEGDYCNFCYDDLEVMADEAAQAAHEDARKDALTNTWMVELEGEDHPF